MELEDLSQYYSIEDENEDKNGDEKEAAEDSELMDIDYACANDVEELLLEDEEINEFVGEIDTINEKISTLRSGLSSKGRLDLQKLDNIIDSLVSMRTAASVEEN